MMVTQKQIDADKDPELLDSAMWEYRRWKASVAAMQGMLSNPTNAGSCEEYAFDAVDHADALIAKFRKTEATT